VFLGIVFLYLFPKKEGFLLLNGLHSPTFDVLFKYLTYLGDGWFALAVIVLLTIKKLQWGILTLWAFIFSGAITQALKNFVFDDVFRPALSVGTDAIHMVEGVEMNHYLSFPSGHSTSASALFFSLALINHNKKLGALYFALAFLAAYSRIYLSQHFPEDVLVGSLIGTTTTLLVFAFLQPKMGKWANKSLVG
jgi:membrane-associated phospholipid phosphatase